MEIGSGIAAGAGMVSIVGGIVALIYRIVPPRIPSVAGKGDVYSADACSERHRAIDDKFARAETDRQEVVVYLRRIESKIDDHIRHTDGQKGNS